MWWEVSCPDGCPGALGGRCRSDPARGRQLAADPEDPDYMPNAHESVWQDYLTSRGVVKDGRPDTTGREDCIRPREGLKTGRPDRSLLHRSEFGLFVAVVVYW